MVHLMASPGPLLLPSPSPFFPSTIPSVFRAFMRTDTIIANCLLIKSLFSTSFQKCLGFRCMCVVCTCVYMCVCMCVHMCVCMCVHMCMHVCACACVCIKSVCVYIRSVCVYIRSVCVDVCLHVDVHCCYTSHTTPACTHTEQHGGDIKVQHSHLHTSEPL